jgi:hypothetical protein
MHLREQEGRNRKEGRKAGRKVSGSNFIGLNLNHREIIGL